MKPTSEQPGAFPASGLRSLHTQLLDVISQAVIATDLEGTVLYWNRAAEELYGWTAEAALGCHVTELTSASPAATDRAQAHMAQVASGEPWSGELVVRHRDGSVFPAFVTAKPIWSEGGEIVGIVGMSHEIEAQKRAEQALAMSDTRFRSMIHNSSEVITLLDAQGVFLYQSPSVERLLGYKPEELEGDSIFRIIHPEDTDAVAGSLERVVREGSDVGALFRVQAKRGDWRWFESRASDLLADEAVGAIVVSSRDVTQRMIHEAALLHRDALLSAASRVAELLATGSDFPEAVNAAFECVAEVTGADRVYLFEKHLDPATGSDLMSQRFEWTRETVTAQLDNPVLQNMPVEALMASWGDALARGEVVGGPVQEAPASLRAELEAEEIRSLLVVPIFSNGQWTGMIGLDDCTTERVWTEAEKSVLSTIANTLGSTIELKRSELRFRTMVHTVAKVIWTADEAGMVTELSDAWSEFTGQPSHEVCGWGWTKALHPDDLARVLPEWQVHLARHVRYETEYRVRRHDGVYHWFAVSCVPVFDDRGRFVEWMGTCSDIDEKRRSETAVRDSETHLRALLETAMDAIITIDGRSRVINLNVAAERIFGYARAEMMGQDLVSLIVPPRFRAEHVLGMDRFDGASPGGVIGRRFETTARRGDGTEIPVEIALTPTTMDDGSQLFTAFIRDFSERKRYEEEILTAKEEAEEMARLKTVFLNNMSHEIRTPLTSIIGFSQVLMDDLHGPGRSMVEMIYKSGERLLDTLNSVLDLAQIESGSLMLRPLRFDVGAFVQDTVDVLRHGAEMRGIALDVVCPEHPVYATLDRGGLARIVTNLTSNAIKFTDVGSVTVTVGTDELDVWVRVADTGVGISPEFLSHIFEEFRQESFGDTRSHEGNGLGLTITKRILDLMGGTIEVTSEKGRGTTFTVRFAR